MNLIAMLMLAMDPNGQALPDVVLLDFTASYCPPCQQMVPVLQRMERDRFPVRKIDTTEEPGLTKQYKVDRLPTLILLVEGQEAKRFVGLTAEEELRRAMNDAARKLDMQRRAAGARPAEPSESFEDFADRQTAEQNQNTVEADPPRTGIRGMFDRMRDGLTGGRNTKQPEEANVRAQSPDSVTPSSPTSLPMQATVRVRLNDGEFSDVGTGTIVHSTIGQSTILTCAHIFKDVGADVLVEVEVFQGREVLKYTASVLGGNHDSDVAFVQIQNKAPLPVAPLLKGKLDLQQNQEVFSVGCNGGDLPTILNQKVLRVNFFNGPENIVSNVEPSQGRSGGGMFNSNGELVGVCSGAFRGKQEGLYTGIGAVRELIKELNLDSLFQRIPAGNFAAAPQEPDPRSNPNPFAQENNDPFDEMFTDNVDVFDELDPVKQETPAFESAPEFPQSAANPPRVVTAVNQSNATPTEITVLIEDPVKGKQVIVIPRPSPWLIELLTGEAPSSNSNVATAAGTQVSTTSARSQARNSAAR